MVGQHFGNGTTVLAYAELQEGFAGLVSGFLNEPDENLTIRVYRK